MKKRLLVISNKFLPTAEQIGPILYRIIKNIQAEKTLVLTNENPLDKKYPSWLFNKDNDTIEIKSKILKTGSDLGKNGIIKKIITAFYLLRFKSFLLINLFKEMKNDNYNILLTSVMAPNFHWFGVIVKILWPSKIWIAFFSDPYSNTPFEEVKKNNLRKLEEKLTFKFADKIIYVSEAQKEFCYKNKGEDKKAVIFPFYYLSEWKKSIIENTTKDKNINNKKINLIHPGNVYGNRNIEEFLKILKKLKKDIKFYNCGNFDKSLIKKFDLEETVISLGYLDYEILLEKINTSDYIIVVDSFFKDIKNPYMPSKVVDAMYFNKPIIAITDEDTELDRFCKITKNLSLRNNSEIIEEKMKEIISGKTHIIPDYTMYCDLNIKII